MAMTLVGLALGAASCEASDGNAETATPAVSLPTVAPSTKEECASKIEEYATQDPDLDSIRDLVPSDQETVDRALDASIGWTVVIADTYECSADYGPQPDGDVVLAEHAAALYLVDVALDDPGIRAVIRSAMVGIDRFYPDSCFETAAELWLAEEAMELEQMGLCT
jgi:hypothetical protein